MVPIAPLFVSIVKPSAFRPTYALIPESPLSNVIVCEAPPENSARALELIVVWDKTNSGVLTVS